MYARVTRNDYCQFLLVAQTNYTLTYFAQHSENFSHDAVTRYLKRDHLRPEHIWKAGQGDIVLSKHGILIFDDTVLDKNHSRHIKMVRQQFSGNEHRVIRGIGLVNCLYLNPETGEFWVIDYRFFDPETDGKDKNEHVSDMLDACFWKCRAGQLEIQTVLMDSWYAITKLMVKIHRAGLLYYCPIKSNRVASEVIEGQKYQYQQVQTLAWKIEEVELGKVVHLREFPQGMDVKLFRIAVATDGSASSLPGAILRARTEFIATNDESPLDAQAVRELHGLRWKVEQYHREIKQLTGIEQCECRSVRAQRNHIACAILVWQCLKRLARDTFRTVYQLKEGLLSDYMRSELKSPSIKYA